MDDSSNSSHTEWTTDFLDKGILGFPVWQLLLMTCSTALFFLVLLCCCVNFRIPRTKQEIEADYIRKQIARKFRRRLNLIPDAEMDEIDLVKAIEKVRFQLRIEDEKAGDGSKTQVDKSPNNTVFSRTQDEQKKDLYDECSNDKSALNASTSKEKLVDRGNDPISNTNRLVTIVNAFTVLRPRRLPNDEKSKQMTV